MIKRLLESFSGGKDWADVASPIAAMGESYWVHWFMYVFLMMVGVMNVVTGLFVDNAVQTSLKDRNDVIMAERDRQRKAMLALRHIFEEADVDGSQTLSWDEFKDHLTKPNVQVEFEALGINVKDLKELFAILDEHSDGSVDISEFVGGLMHLKGSATSLDLVVLLTKTRGMAKELDRISNMLSTLCDRRPPVDSLRQAASHTLKSEVTGG
eukprot:gnl/TRDRNA2_/TRDRNA2_176126_c4_seq23.p1 gnl/TRDRNA2_/TRDRNA2_176126_c4~~gnl/TRDRNA2_/TRDRNA2_176126_c4_seq23.p1  ORF type:complete len:211 (-),score=29.41 gnl/TRDRNA2_/TRDRNA2_176126_c4_seq23:325-957(-)